MNDTKATESACIATFSKVTATISHEIKNALSIINENAGLLDDLVLMTAPEEGVDPQRVKKTAATIARQVSRANDIMSNVNKFAHSADYLIARESLQSICSLLITLAQRQAVSKNIEITLDCPVDISVQTYLLQLESVLYLTIREIIDQSHDGAALTIRIARAEGGKASAMFHSEAMSDSTLAGLSEYNLESMMALLEATWTGDGDSQTLTFPADIEKERS